MKSTNGFIDRRTNVKYESVTSFIKHRRNLILLRESKINKPCVVSPSEVYKAFLEKLTLSDKSKTILNNAGVSDENIDYLCLRNSPSFPLNLLISCGLKRQFGTLDEIDGFTRRLSGTYEYAETRLDNAILNVRSNHSHYGFIALDRNKQKQITGLRLFTSANAEKSFRIKTKI